MKKSRRHSPRARKKKKGVLTGRLQGKRDKNWLFKTRHFFVFVFMFYLIVWVIVSFFFFLIFVCSMRFNLSTQFPNKSCHNHTRGHTFNYANYVIVPYLSLRIQTYAYNALTLILDSILAEFFFPFHKPCHYFYPCLLI